MIEPHDQQGPARPDQQIRRFAHDAMACTFELLLAERDADYAARAAEATFAELAQLEQELSRFVPTSDIARINALAAGESVRVGIELIECLQLAVQIHDETDGAFDVTWSTRRDAEAAHLSPLKINPEGCEVIAQASGVEVDLGAIGKGYAVDRIVTLLRDWSITAALVHCGQSTVFALGTAPGKKDWTVAIRDPAEHDDTLARVWLRDVALSGSGRWLHGEHIIDPRSDRPVTDRLGAWALAPSAARADALSTAFMVMRPEEVEAYCARHAGVSALLHGFAAGGPAMTSFGEMPVSRLD